jgi:GntR family transcriptional regulator/MocR family aminotransferase
LINPLVKIRSTMDQHSSAIDQATLARFISEGFFLKHLRRMRKLYAERREFFVNEFNKLLSDRFKLQIPEAGLNFVAWLRCKEDFARVARISQEIGIKPSPLSFYCIQAKLRPAFVFGFAAWTPAQIRESLLRLASAIR